MTTRSSFPHSSIFPSPPRPRPPLDHDLNAAKPSSSPANVDDPPRRPDPSAPRPRHRRAPMPATPRPNILACRPYAGHDKPPKAALTAPSS